MSLESGFVFSEAKAWPVCNSLFLLPAYADVEHSATPPASLYLPAMLPNVRN